MTGGDIPKPTFSSNLSGNITFGFFGKNRENWGG
jgi:hypothetical protein